MPFHFEPDIEEPIDPNAPELIGMTGQPVGTPLTGGPGVAALTEWVDKMRTAAIETGITGEPPTPAPWVVPPEEVDLPMGVMVNAPPVEPLKLPADRGRIPLDETVNTEPKISPMAEELKREPTVDLVAFALLFSG